MEEEELVFKKLDEFLKIEFSEPIY